MYELMQAQRSGVRRRVRRGDEGAPGRRPARPHRRAAGRPGGRVARPRRHRRAGRGGRGRGIARCGR
nr:hypothetical protein [Angustibacter aerolatus]